MLIIVAFMSDVLAGDLVHGAMPREIGTGANHQHSIETRAHLARVELEPTHDRTSLSMQFVPPKMTSGEPMCHPCCTANKAYCPALVPSAFDAIGRGLLAARTGAPIHKLISWQPPPPQHPPNLVV